MLAEGTGVAFSFLSLASPPSFDLSLPPNFMLEKNDLKSFALGLSFAAFSAFEASGGGFVPIGAKCAAWSASRASESSSSMISSGGPEAPYCTDGRLDGCREPYKRDCCDGGAVQPGPNASGLPLAPPVASPNDQLSTPQRLLSIDGLGSSFECVEPGRGD